MNYKETLDIILGSSEYSEELKGKINDFANEKSDKIIHALVFAFNSHKGQFRKYSNNTIPYIIHPVEVAELLSQYITDEDMICAALLHDVVEDCGVNLQSIKTYFGLDVAIYVNGLTDVSVKADGVRAVRKAMDRKHTSMQCGFTKTIKLCDLINNSSSIVKADEKFAKVYMAEKRLLLDEALAEGLPELWYIADKIVRDYYNQ